MVHDAALLERYAQTRDAEAFAELVRRHAGAVYGTCLRITRNPDDAEDAAQECFLELARRAATITASVPGWLHTAATNRSLNAIRDASTRRRHEEQAMNGNHRNDEPAWDDIAPLVDAALEDLPGDLRVPLVLHFMEGRSQQEIAGDLGVNQSTVSRRIEAGLDGLREKLKRAGVVASVAVLGALLAENAASAAPATLAATLGKMAMAGIGEAAGTAATASAAGAASSGRIFGSLTARLLAAAALVAIAVGGIVALRLTTGPDRNMPAGQPPMEAPKPQPVAEQPAPNPADKENIVNAKLDYSTIELQGNGHEKDSFSLTVQAVAKLLGKGVDYETVAALSSNVFAPCICTGESCTAWWHMYARDRCMDLVGKALGLRFRRLELPVFEGEMTDARLAEYDSACAPIVRQAIDNGQVVVTSGGWQVTGGPYGLVPWCWWGMVYLKDHLAKYYAAAGQ